MYQYSVFVFKQKTAYYIRISDWISDVFSSDLRRVNFREVELHQDVVARNAEMRRAEGDEGRGIETADPDDGQLRNVRLEPQQPGIGVVEGRLDRKRDG